MGVYKRKDSKKRWWISFSVQGKLYREAAGDTKMQAEALLAKRRLELYEGRFFPNKRRADLTFEGLRCLWLEHATHKRSLSDDERRFEAILNFFGAAVRVASVLPSDLERFKNTLAAAKTRRGQTMAPATVNRHLALLSAAMRVALKNHHLHNNPALGLKKLPEHNERDRICTEDEYAALVANAYPKLRLAIIFGRHTGMRMTEITSLAWGRLNLRERTATLPGGLTKNGVGRLVPLNRDVLQVLQQLPRSIDGKLFDVDKRTLSPAFTRLCRKLGIVGLRFHDLRHTAATGLRRGGADVFTIAAITGHKDLASLRRYNTVTVKDMHRAIDQAQIVVTADDDANCVSKPKHAVDAVGQAQTRPTSTTNSPG